MHSCRHCHTSVLEKHRVNRAPDDKILHVLIVIYCSWTSGLTQASNNLGHLQGLAGPLCTDDRNLQIQMVIVRKLIYIKRLLIHQNEATKYFVFDG